VENRILVSVKKILGIDEAYTAFDLDIMTHINSVFSTLNQLGIGPDAGFMIEDDSATWDTFLANDTDGTPDPKLNSVKTYMHQRVRLVFDPPQTSYLVESYKEQIRELEWRLNVKREGEKWTDPDPTPEPEPVIW
jgi:hypothetical protein